MAIERELNTDPELQKLYRAHLNVEDFLKHREEDVAFLKAARSAEQEYRFGTYLLRNRAFKVAASVILVAGISATSYVLLNSRKSNSEIVAENYSPYMPGLITRDGNAQTKFWMYCLENFADENYKETIECLNGSGSDSLICWKMFFLGQSYIATGEYSKAASCLRQASSDSDADMFREHIDWYLSLALIGSGNEEEGIVKLREIAKSSAFYKAKAESLIMQLSGD
jgi:tetratricopeptide (TPR) repeat protein